MPDDEISEEGRQARFERWEKLGIDRVKHDLLNGGDRLVGGPAQVRELAWEWARKKEAELGKLPDQTEDLVMLKPGIWGMTVNINEAVRRI
jgi:hypothetical protein